VDKVEKVEKDKLAHNTETNRHVEQKLDIFDAVEPKNKSAEAMVIDVNVGEGERLAKPNDKASKCDAAMIKSLDHIAETDNILEKTAELPEDAAKHATTLDNVEADAAKTLKAKMT
jgi:hypothetical protein